LKLAGKVAVVTGASRGIGRSIAESFAREGAKVVISARQKETLEAVRAGMKSNGADVLSVVAAVADEDDVINLFKSAVKAYDKVDILVNNAGFGMFKPVAEMKTSDYDTLFDVNMRGTFIATREVLPHMMKQNDGVIINIASLASKNAVENGAVYAATKWAMLGFAKSLMLEVRKYNIRVNTICPGSVDTDFGFGHHPNRDKILKPEDVADAALLAATAPVRAMISEIDLRPTNPK